MNGLVTGGVHRALSLSQEFGPLYVGADTYGNINYYLRNMCIKIKLYNYS